MYFKESWRVVVFVSLFFRNYTKKGYHKRRITCNTDINESNASPLQKADGFQPVNVCCNRRNYSREATNLSSKLLEAHNKNREN